MRSLFEVDESLDLILECLAKFEEKIERQKHEIKVLQKVVTHHRLNDDHGSVIELKIEKSDDKANEVIAAALS